VGAALRYRAAAAAGRQGDADRRIDQLEVAAGREVLGVQFMQEGAAAGALWPASRYRFELHASIGRPGAGEVDIGVTFIVEVGRFEAGQVKLWSLAPAAMWDRLGDPDRAVAIPVRVVRAPGLDGA
jgi:hypothetical protein